MARTRQLALVLCCALAAGLGGATLAAFSGQTTSSASFTAADTFPGQLRMASGTYTGDGNDNRSITGLGFQPDVVIVKGDTGEVAMLRTSTMPGEGAKQMAGGSSLDNDRIQAIEADGFQLGKHNSANGSGRVYYWTAFQAAEGVLHVGSYTGNGGTQAIAGVGFSPEYVMVAVDDKERPVQWFAGATQSYRFEADGGIANGVTGVGSNGFTVGNANEVNKNGKTVHYVAFNESPGNVKVGTYDGAGGSQAVAGVGFEPEYVIVRGQANVSGQHRNQLVPGSQSMYFTNNTNISTGITELQPDGFEVGNHSSVNSSGTSYRYVAFDNGAGGCARPTSGQVIMAANDSWVDQANPSANEGGNIGLWVASQSGANRRAFVDFDLPSLPSGCVVTSAYHYMYNAFPAAGRTLEVRRASSSWGENGITWNNQPEVTGDAATAVMPGSAGYVLWDVTDQTNGLFSSGNFGFRIADQSEGTGTATQIFGSRDSDVPPGLIFSVGSPG